MQEKDIRDVLQAYPELKHAVEGKTDVFQGILRINHIEEKTNVYLVGEFAIKIIVCEEYPIELPKVYDIGNSIENTYIHRYSDGELCLESITRLKLFCKSHSVKEFVDLFLINYLCSYLYYKRYLMYPNGERPHGLEGEYDFLKDFFDLPVSKVLTILMSMIKDGIKRNEECPCGSGKQVKKCHWKKMIELQNGIQIDGIKKLIYDLKECFKGDLN